MSKPYATAMEKLEFIKCAVLSGRPVPTSQIRMMSEALYFALEVLSGTETDSSISPARVIAVLRKELEKRILP